jgi:hypothetical protein
MDIDGQFLVQRTKGEVQMERILVAARGLILVARVVAGSAV